MQIPVLLRLLLVVVVSLSLFACASRDKNPYGNPCRVMEMEAREMQALDAEIAEMEAEVKKLEKAGDEEGVASLKNRVLRLRDQRRDLQHSLERSAADCLPLIHDMPPVRDPAKRERERITN